MPELEPIASIWKRQNRRIAVGGDGRYYPQHYQTEQTGDYPRQAGWVTYDDHQGAISYDTIEQAANWLAPMPRSRQ